MLLSRSTSTVHGLSFESCRGEILHLQVVLGGFVSESIQMKIL